MDIHNVINNMKLSEKTVNTKKKIYNIAISFFIIIALYLIAFHTSTFSNEAIKIKLVAFEYPPFSWEENGKINGVAVELANELFRRLNIQTELNIYPLKRALYYLETDEADGTMMLIKTQEREKYLYYTNPVITVRGLIWAAADRGIESIEFEKLEDLKSYIIGVTSGYSYGEQFDAILENMEVDKAPGDLNNYKKLLEHRIDIFPGNEIVARFLFKKHSELQGKFIHSQKAFMEWPLHMGICKKSRLVSLIPDINKILNDLKNEGIIDRIIKQYTE